ncbi:MAG: hypothetical protein J0H66_06955 [Solirubrobacterales bacterium]|nr:hypothetical protein [Solirubrobacterales bacterium]
METKIATRSATAPPPSTSETPIARFSGTPSRVTPASSAKPTLAPDLARASVLRASQLSTTTNTVAPSRKETPALPAPPCSKASSNSSKATAETRAPEANPSIIASTGFGILNLAPARAPIGRAADAITA